MGGVISMYMEVAKHVAGVGTEGKTGSQELQAPPCGQGCACACARVQWGLSGRLCMTAVRSRWPVRGVSLKKQGMCNRNGETWSTGGHGDLGQHDFCLQL